MAELSGAEATRQLVALSNSVTLFLFLFDRAQTGPSGVERGRQIARLANRLDLQNDLVRQKLGLGGTTKEEHAKAMLGEEG